MTDRVIHLLRTVIGWLVLVGLSGLSVACRIDSTVAPLPASTSTDSAVISPPTATLPGATPTISLPTLALQATPTVLPTPGQITLTLVYDNRPYDARLATDWGLACVIEDGPTTVLFDTGGSSSILLDNLNILQIDVRHIAAVVLSHSHSDHTGGLPAVLSVVTTTVYAPSAVIRTLPIALRDLS